jgi:hypothetical protein
MLRGEEELPALSGASVFLIRLVGAVLTTPGELVTFIWGWALLSYPVLLTYYGGNMNLLASPALNSALRQRLHLGLSFL